MIHLRQKPDAPLLLRAGALAIFVLPANMVLAPLGAMGYVAMVIGLLLFGIWLASALWGLHDPLRFRYPARFGLGCLWLALVAAYIAMAYQSWATAAQLAGADRGLFLVAGISGYILVSAESIRTVYQAASLLRAVVLGSAVCGLVAIYQGFTFTDPFDLVRSAMVGFVDNGGNTTFQLRGFFVRSAGSTFTPIELGVVSAMTLPVALWLALYSKKEKRLTAWTPVVIIGLSAVVSVSRSAILSLVVAIAIFVPFLPHLARRWALALLPVVVIALFVAIPGLIATFAELFTAGSSDPSLTTRTNNFVRVENMVTDHPAFGTGPGSYLPTNALHILDNQYFRTAVEQGLVGLSALAIFLLLPFVSALWAARKAQEPRLRSLCGAVAAACGIAIVSSATFDSLAFPVFTIVSAIMIGLSGSCWMLVKSRQASYEGRRTPVGSWEYSYLEAASVDPMSVLKTVLKHKLITIPILVLTLVGSIAVYFYGPRTYESSATYVLISPQLPSQEQLETDPRYSGLNSDNPYLRSPDPSLALTVLISRLAASEMAGALERSGLSSDYIVEQAGGLAGSLMVKVTGHGSSPELSLRTTEALGTELITQLKELQQVNGADDEFLMTALLVETSDRAVERTSSRLRLVIMVAAAGVVLLIGALSVARSRERNRPPARHAAPELSPKQFKNL